MVIWLHQCRVFCFIFVFEKWIKNYRKSIKKTFIGRRITNPAERVERLQRIADILNIDSRQLLPEKNGHHFENVSYSQIDCVKVVNQNSNKTMELYDNIINRQQKEIEYLKGIIDMIKK